MFAVLVGRPWPVARSSMMPAWWLRCRVWRAGLAGLYAAHLVYWSVSFLVVARQRRRIAAQTGALSR